VTLSKDHNFLQSISEIENLIHRTMYKEAREKIDKINLTISSNQEKFKLKIIEVKFNRHTEFNFRQRLTEDDFSAISLLGDEELFGEAIIEFIYPIAFTENIEEAKNLVNKHRELVLSLATAETRATFLLLEGAIEGIGGNIQTAISLTLESLEIRRKDGKPLLVAQCCFNLRSCYRQIGDFETALQYAIETSRIQRQLNNTLYTFYGLSGLFGSYFSLEDFANAKIILEEMDEIYQENLDSPNIKIIYFTAQAKLLSKKTRLKDKILAQDLLFKVVYDGEYDLQQLIEAMILYCELLVLELKASTEQETVDELQRGISHLLMIVKSKNRSTALIEILILNGQIQFILGNFDEAENSFIESVDLADKTQNFQLKNMAQKELTEYQNQIAEVSKDSGLSQGQAIIDRMERTKLENYLEMLKEKNYI